MYHILYENIYRIDKLSFNHEANTIFVKFVPNITGLTS